MPTDTREWSKERRRVNPHAPETQCCPPCLYRCTAQTPLTARRFSRLRQNLHLPGDTSNDLDSPFQHVLGVRRCHDRADARFAFGYGGITDTSRKQPFVE